MEFLYCKGSLARRREFQVITSIVQNGNSRYVIKRAALPESNTHIERTFKMEELAECSYDAYVVHSVWQEDKLITPFVEGMNMGERLKKAYLNNEQSEIIHLLQQWKRVIIGKDSNVIKFSITKPFEKIFGKLKELEGAYATRISNFDCSCENVIFTNDGQIKCIDLEWVFDFSIPIEFNYYRVIQGFYSFNKDICKWRDLCRIAEIDEKMIPFYERGIDSFYKYVHVDQDSGIDYRTYGKGFKNSAIKQSFKKGDNEYIFPQVVCDNYKKIAVYGAGKVGKEFVSILRQRTDLTLSIWVDKKADLYRKQGIDISNVSELLHTNYDIILIAVRNEVVAIEIIDELIQLGIDRNRMFWSRPEIS